MPHRGSRDGSYTSKRGEHIAFGKKRSVTVTFTRAARKSKRYSVVVSRRHVHITRTRSSRSRPKLRRRQRGRKHRKQRRRRSRRF